MTGTSQYHPALRGAVDLSDDDMHDQSVGVATSSEEEVFSDPDDRRDTGNAAVRPSGLDARATDEVNHERYSDEVFGLDEEQPHDIRSNEADNGAGSIASTAPRIQASLRVEREDDDAAHSLPNWLADVEFHRTMQVRDASPASDHLVMDEQDDENGEDGENVDDFSLVLHDVLEFEGDESTSSSEQEEQEQSASSHGSAASVPGLEDAAVEADYDDEAFDVWRDDLILITRHGPRINPRYSRKPRSTHAAGLDEAYAREQARLVQEKVEMVPSIPVLHCSASHLRIIYAPQADTPHIFCARLLKQYLPPLLENSVHAALDRLNMIQQIPELGIVIVATQLGRCAVCSLTRRGHDGVFGLRVDWVLPTKKQENEGLRPGAPLLGIAAGPIQGRMTDEQISSSSDSEHELQAMVDSVGSISTEPDSHRLEHSPSARRRLSETMRSPDEGGWRHPDGGSPETPLCGSEPQSPPSKRKRRSSSSQSADSPSLRKSFATSSPQDSRRKGKRSGRRLSAERWTGIEYSRRYRLMLMYTDHTVLTYELWRDAEETGLGSKDGSEVSDWTRKNWRNRLPGVF